MRYNEIMVTDENTAPTRRASHTRCPLCGDPFGTQPTSLDHVVPKAMGGVDREQVRVCSPCNNGLGTELEGALLGRTGVLTKLSVQRGWATSRLDAVSPAGLRYDWDAATADATLKGPSHTVEPAAEGKTTVHFMLPMHLLDGVDLDDPYAVLRHGYPGHILRKILGERGGEVSGAEIVSRGEQTEGIAEIPVDLPLLRRLAAKVAINAGAFEWGESFTSSALAEWLRELLDARQSWTGTARKSQVLSGSRLADQINSPSDSTTVQMLQAALIAPDISFLHKPYVDFGRVNATTTWIRVHLLDVDLPQLIAPHGFHNDLADDDITRIELSQRDIRSS